VDPFITIHKIFLRAGHQPNTMVWSRQFDFFDDGERWASYCERCNSLLSYASRGLFSELPIIRVRVKDNLLATLTYADDELSQLSGRLHGYNVCEKYKILL
jgi:hypothetical protein